MCDSLPLTTSISIWVTLCFVLLSFLQMLHNPPKHPNPILFSFLFSFPAWWWHVQQGDRMPEHVSRGLLWSCETLVHCNVSIYPYFLDICLACERGRPLLDIIITVHGWTGLALALALASASKKKKKKKACSWWRGTWRLKGHLPIKGYTSRTKKIIKRKEMKRRSWEKEEAEKRKSEKEQPTLPCPTTSISIFIIYSSLYLV